MNLEIVKQAKNDFLNNNHNDTLRTHLILSYYNPAPGGTPILFHLKLVKAISLQKNEIYFNQGNHEYECPADVLLELPCPICEFLSLKLP